MTSTLPFAMFDADNHYYESMDAFTRHIDPKLRSRAMQWAEIDGKTRLLVAGKVNKFIPNPTFDPIAKPGVLVSYFKGEGQGNKSVLEAFGELEPIRPEYRDRAVRLQVMDEQGMEGCWMFPTLGVGMEVVLRHEDPEACLAAFRAFNRWLDEDWGFAYQDRMFAAPYLSLIDLDAAVAELEWCINRGARVIVMLPAPVAVRGGTTSPFTEEYDPFWARAAEAGITVTMHGGDSGYNDYVRAWEPGVQSRAFFATPLQRVVTSDRPIMDTLAAAICHRVFERHPRLRFASIENGAGWVKVLLKKLDLAGHQTPGWFAERPSTTFNRHVWVSPFWEDSHVAAAETIGIDRTIFGSDWPHTEGIPEPAGYADQIADLGPDSVRKIMRDNAWELTRPPVH